MLAREKLWQRISGGNLWPLPWALLLACALPWLLPETWDGSLSAGRLWAGYLLLGTSMPLLLWKRWRFLPICLGLIWATYLGMASEARWEHGLPTGLVDLEGTLDAPWTMQGDRLTGRLRVRQPSTLADRSLPLSLPAQGDPPPPPGTPVRFRAELRPVEAAPPFLGERPLWRARTTGEPRRIYLRSALQMETLGPPQPSHLLRLQLFLHERFRALPIPDLFSRDLWGALTLGIPPAQAETFSIFSESGTIHMLVVSGLQVTLIMAFAEAMARRLFRRGSSWTGVCVGVLYGTVVGFSAPVWRGLLMGLAWVAGRGTGWRLPPILSLYGALISWILVHPASGADPGFLLAWFALLGLLWGVDPLAGLFSPLLGRFATPFSSLLAPWLSTLPLLALLHGGAPLWGVAANALLLPLMTVLTPLCLFLILVPIPSLVHGTAAILAWLGAHAMPVFAGIAPLCTGILWPWIALAAGWILLAHRAMTLRRTRALTCGLLAVSVLFLATKGTGSNATQLTLEAPDLSLGESLLLRVPDADATLIDTGATPWEARRVVRMLSRRGVREPLHLILTHPHGDHAGGWSTLARLWPLADTHGAAIAEPALWDPYVPKGNNPEPLLRGAAWRRGNAAFSVRWPPKPFALQDPNMLSVVLRVRWQDHELWLMGDALSLQERDLMDLGDPESASSDAFHRLLKAGHHGSSGASDPRWLSALSPELVLFTAGRNNRFGFPSPAVLETLHHMGAIPSVTTGPAYGIRIVAVPAGWRVETGMDGLSPP